MDEIKKCSISNSIHVTNLISLTVYGVEALLKIIGLGISDYFHSGWNVWDFTITVLAIGGTIAEKFANSFFYVVILRPMRFGGDFLLYL